jgi:RNA polymerase sigma-70 factor (ECF subfamily)
MGNGMDSESLYEEFYKDCYAFAKSRLRSTEETEDLVQNAFLKALDNEELLAVMSTPQRKNWLFCVVRNLIIDGWRKKQRRDIKQDLLLRDGEEFSENHEYAVDLKVLSDSCLENLPPHFSTVLRMKFWDSLNSKEIGEQIGVPPGTVRYWISEGLRLVRSMLENGGV